MEGAGWPDRRLDERMTLIDEKFDRGFDEMRSVREEMRVGFAAVHGDLAAIRGDMAAMRGDISELRGGLSALQRQLTQIFAGFAIALLGVIAAGIVATF
jgi:hypothetical protein